MTKPPEIHRVHNPLEPLAQDDLCILQEEFSTGLEDALTFVRYECSGVRLEFVRGES